MIRLLPSKLPFCQAVKLNHLFKKDPPTYLLFWPLAELKSLQVWNLLESWKMREQSSSPSLTAKRLVLIYLFIYFYSGLISDSSFTFLHRLYFNYPLYLINLMWPCFTWVRRFSAPSDLPLWYNMIWWLLFNDLSLYFHSWYWCINRPRRRKRSLQLPMRSFHRAHSFNWKRYFWLFPVSRLANRSIIIYISLPLGILTLYFSTYSKLVMAN